MWLRISQMIYGILIIGLYLSHPWRVEEPVVKIMLESNDNGTLTMCKSRESEYIGQCNDDAETTCSHHFPSVVDRCSLSPFITDENRASYVMMRTVLIWLCATPPAFGFHLLLVGTLPEEPNLNHPTFLMRWSFLAIIDSLLLPWSQHLVSVFSCRPVESLYDGLQVSKILAQFVNTSLMIYLGFIVGTMFMRSKLARWHLRHGPVRRN